MKLMKQSVVWVYLLYLLLISLAGVAMTLMGCRAAAPSHPEAPQATSAGVETYIPPTLTVSRGACQVQVTVPFGQQWYVFDGGSALHVVGIRTDGEVLQVRLDMPQTQDGPGYPGQGEPSGLPAEKHGPLSPFVRGGWAVTFSCGEMSPRPEMAVAADGRGDRGAWLGIVREGEASGW